jgi:hypothetical protein
MRPVLTRRAGLAALALAPVALVAAACTSGDSSPTPTGSGPSLDGDPPTPAGVAAQAAAAESELISLYDAAIAALGPTGEERALLLTSLREQHAAHREALGGADDVPAPTRAPDLGALISAERGAARARIRSCVDAEDPELARVLALIAASEAAHVPALRQVRA